MSYNDLLLNRERLRQSVSTIPGITVQETPASQGRQKHYRLTAAGEAEGLLIIHLKTTGKTTLQTKAGKNPALSERAAAYLATQCQMPELPPFGVSVPTFAKADVDLIIAYLVENGASVINDEAQATCRLRKLRGQHDDDLTIKEHHNGTLQLQGRPLALYSQALTLLAELRPTEDYLWKAIRNASIDTDAVQARQRLARLLPLSHNFLGGGLQTILSPICALEQIDIHGLEDYSMFTFPALRALEGYLKKVLDHFGIPVGRTFDMFTQSTSSAHPFQLRQDVVPLLPSVAACNAVEDAYAFYNGNRHNLFHSPVDTDLIPTISQRALADQIAIDVCRLIEKVHQEASLP